MKLKTKYMLATAFWILLLIAGWQISNEKSHPWVMFVIWLTVTTSVYIWLIKDFKVRRKIEKRIKPLLKRATVTTLICVILILAYFAFWPRYTFTIYGYHDIKSKNEICDYWSITLDPSEQTFIYLDAKKDTLWNRIHPPNLKKVNIFGSPYDLEIWHCSKLKISKVDIMKAHEVFFSSDEIRQVNRSKNRVLSKCKDIKLTYDNYELVIYYSLEDQGDIVNYTSKEPLKIKFTEDKVSWFEIAQGI